METARKVDELKSNMSLNGSKPLRQAEEFGHKISDMASQIKDASSTAVNESIGFVKKYPFHAALGAAAVGYLAGMFSRRSK